MSMLSASRQGPTAFLAFVAAAAWTLVGTAPTASAAPPIPYTSPFHQSPVRGGPGDLLMIPGSGFATSDTVVYQRLTDTTLPLAPPAGVPAISDADLGVIPLFASSPIIGPPQALNVKLPSTMLPGTSYALWIANGQHQWSSGIKLNDARPLWISPSLTSSNPSPGFPRKLKVVGRNLEPAPGHTTNVRLTNGPVTYILNAANDGDPSTAIEHYVALVDLPTGMPAGDYSIEVQRDGVSWVPLDANRKLEILPDPRPAATFYVSDPQFGGCVPNDRGPAGDDTHCVIRAIATAHSAGGGDVVFPPGGWLLDKPSGRGLSAKNGIQVPAGVNLRSAFPADRASVVKGIHWHDVTHPYHPVFSLTSHNTVRDLVFVDKEQYGPNDNTTFIQLGVDGADAGEVVEEVLITNNVFDGAYAGIRSNDSRISRLYVTKNEFGAHATAIWLNGNDTLHDFRYQINDSIITDNTFMPGSTGVDACENPGTIAVQIGAANRLDFSNNEANGHATDYLHGGVPGWRAAFFFHLNNNHERVLVSRNTATCTGDLRGDGEAIAFDNNGNSYGFARAKDVIASTSTTVTVATPPGEKLNRNPNQKENEEAGDLCDDTKVTSCSNYESYYNEHWIQIGSGPGLGQARKIVSYTDPSQPTMTFTVSPPFDVVPVAGESRIGVSRQDWQVYVVDNAVDNRGQICTRDNVNGMKWAGIIGMSSVATDSTFDGNIQEQSSGISIDADYKDLEFTNECHEPMRSYRFKYFVDIRGNTIDGEYDYENAWSFIGGITLAYGGGVGLIDCTPKPGCACTYPPVPPPLPVVPGYGVTVSRNVIRHADGRDGGAISSFSGFGEPNSAMYQNTLVYKNQILDQSPAPWTDARYDQCSSDPDPLATGHSPHREIGIRIGQRSWYGIYDQNLFDASVLVPYSDVGEWNIH